MVIAQSIVGEKRKKRPLGGCSLVDLEEEEGSDVQGKRGRGPGGGTVDGKEGGQLGERKRGNLRPPF